MSSAEQGGRVMPKVESGAIATSKAGQGDGVTPMKRTWAVMMSFAPQRVRETSSAELGDGSCVP